MGQEFIAKVQTNQRRGVELRSNFDDFPLR